MEEQFSPLAVTHLLQHTLRSLCIHENSQWVYAVFWRILPRNYPPPKWDGQGGCDRSRGNRRNWILLWEDGFCNFAASTAEMNYGECSTAFPNCEFQQYQWLQPELFFKMSHEIYNYGEGIIGKVAADRSHKWIYKEPNDQDINFLSPWHSSADSYPRTWEAQFQSGIKTIALIAVREGVVQLGAISKVIEDLSYVVLLRKKFSYIESIPGVLLPHPSSGAFPYKVDGYLTPEAAWHYEQGLAIAPPSTPHDQFYNDHFIGDRYQAMPFRVTPSMSSLEALLSKLPSVAPPHSASAFDGDHCSQGMMNSGSVYNYLPIQRPMELLGIEKVAKVEVDDDENSEEDGGRSINHHPPQEYHHNNRHVDDVGESSSSMATYLSNNNFLNSTI